MFLRPVRTTQPQGPARIDWSNPITRGLEVWINGADNSTYRLTSGVGGRSVTPRGVSPLLSGGQGYTGNLPKLRDATQEITVFVISSRTSGSTSVRLFRAFGGGVTTYDCRYSNGTTFRIEPIDRDNLTAPSAIFPAAALGRLTANCATFSTIKDEFAIFSNGRFISATSYGATPDNAYESALSIELGGLFAGHCPLLLIFNRALSGAEVKSLSDNPWQVFTSDSKPLWVPAAVSVSLPTLVRPSSTISAGAWTATGAATLHEAIDEEFYEFADFISVNSASTTELELAEAAFPGGANQTLAYWASSTQGSTLTVTLKQGATQIMTRTHTLTATDTLYTQTLTAPEIALITAGAISVTLTTS